MSERLLYGSIINLMIIEKDNFNKLFYSVLNKLVDKYSNGPYIYNFKFISKKIESYKLEKFNYCAKNMYEYFQRFYEDFYDYDWIMHLIQYYKRYKYEYDIDIENIEYDMVGIVNLVINHYSNYVIQSMLNHENKHKKL
jgi:hypothetical protein